MVKHFYLGYIFLFFFFSSLSSLLSLSLLISSPTFSPFFSLSASLDIHEDLPKKQWDNQVEKDKLNLSFC